MCAQLLIDSKNMSILHWSYLLCAMSLALQEHSFQPDGIASETLDLIVMGLGLLSLLLLILSFLSLPALGPLAALSGLGSLVWGWWRRKKQGRTNLRTLIGLWAGVPALLVFLTTLGLVLFF